LTKTLYLIAGPSGSGKTTLTNKLMEEENIVELVSHTTRDMRKGEKEGKTYYYINDKEFRDLDKLEHASHEDKKYCLSRKEYDNKFKNNNDVDKAFVIVNEHGINQIKEKDLDCDIVVINIWCYPPDAFDRIKQRDGKVKAENRFEYDLKIGAFNLFDIADYSINNSNGNFNKSFNKLKEITIKEKEVSGISW